jgi:hypothetical protein
MQGLEKEAVTHEDGGCSAARVVKRGRHRCGYPLVVEMLQDFGDRLVVNYRSGEEGAMPLLLWLCPQCEQALPLWWPVATWEAWGLARNG